MDAYTRFIENEMARQGESDHLVPASPNPFGAKERDSQRVPDYNSVTNYEICFGTVVNCFKGESDDSYELELDFMTATRVIAQGDVLQTPFPLELASGDEVQIHYNIVEKEEDDEDTDDSHIQVQKFAPLHDTGVKLVTSFTPDHIIVDYDYHLPRSRLEDTRTTVAHGDAIDVQAVKCNHRSHIFRVVWGKLLDEETRNALFPSETELKSKITLAVENKNGLTLDPGEAVFKIITPLGDSDEKMLLLTNITTKMSLKLLSITLKEDKSRFEVISPDLSRGPLTVGPQSKHIIHIRATSEETGIFQESIMFEFNSNIQILRSFKLYVGDEQFVTKHSTAYVPPVDPPPAVLLADFNRIQMKKVSRSAGFRNTNKLSRKEWPVLGSIAKLLATENWRSELMRGGMEWLYCPLTIHSFVEKLHICLFVEELMLYKAIHAMKDTGIILLRVAYKNKMHHYKLVCKHPLAESRPSPMAGDIVFCENKSKKKSFSGVIVEVQADALVVKMDDDFEEFSMLAYDVSFKLTRVCYQRQHDAIELISGGPRFESLFPTTAQLTTKAALLDVELAKDGRLTIAKDGKERRYLNLTRDDLDASQRQVIRNVLRGEQRSLPYLIRGPPGTGKTTTLAEIVVQLISHLDDSRILVCTQSNSAANLILAKLLETGRILKEDIIRVIGATVYSSGSIPQELKQYCGTFANKIERDESSTGSEEEDEHDSVRAGLDLETLCTFRVVVVTCGSVGKFNDVKLSSTHFTHLILDEAGQCMETEAIMAITLLEHEESQVILAGDDKQLGPVVFCPDLEGTQFDMSLFERLQQLPLYDFKDPQYNRSLSNQLNYNYRSVPSILHVFNSLFYSFKLEAMVQSGEKFDMLQRLQAILPEDATRSPKQGIFFYGVVGNHQRAATSPSWLNPKEAEVVIDLLKKMMAIGIAADQIGVISPYQGQVRYIRLIASERNIQGIKIGSVEEFQGQERPIILLSTVRSSKDQFEFDKKYHLGFVHHPKRMNVAISRAQSLLIVVGNSMILDLDENWKTLVSRCRSKGAYVDTEDVLVNLLAQ